jgi:hypothetical protein
VDVEVGVDVAVEHLEALRAFLAPAKATSEPPTGSTPTTGRSAVPRLHRRRAAATDTSSGGDAA